MRRDVQGLKADAEELTRVAQETNMPTWSAYASWHRAEALAMQGRLQEGIEQMREAMAECVSTDVCVYLPRAHCALAEAKAKGGRPEEALATLAEALELAEETGEMHWEAELHRLRAELLVTLGDGAGAQASFHQAIEVARRQRATSWELRSAIGLARLWQEQGRIDEARQLLAEISGWFTEGHDTPDLQEAAELLDALST
jgi:adenylate cyclase